MGDGGGLGPVWGPGGLTGTRTPPPAPPSAPPQSSQCSQLPQFPTLIEDGLRQHGAQLSRPAVAVAIRRLEADPHHVHVHLLVVLQRAGCVGGSQNWGGVRTPSWGRKDPPPPKPPPQSPPPLKGSMPSCSFFSMAASISFFFTHWMPRLLKLGVGRGGGVRPLPINGPQPHTWPYRVGGEWEWGLGPVWGLGGGYGSSMGTGRGIWDQYGDWEGDMGPVWGLGGGYGTNMGTGRGNWDQYGDWERDMGPVWGLGEGIWDQYGDWVRELGPVWGLGEGYGTSMGTGRGIWDQYGDFERDMGPV